MPSWYAVSADDLLPGFADGLSMSPRGTESEPVSRETPYISVNALRLGWTAS
ncbi:hypothetical protein QF015_001455 [Paenarthrobacter sp. TE4293]